MIYKKPISILFVILLVLFIHVFAPGTIHADNIDHPQIFSQPVIKWGNSSYHDSLGARDPWAIKDNGTTYLYYDCTEDLLNPSFESNLGTNGWDTYEAQITTSSDEHLFGQQSLKVLTSNKATVGPLSYGAFTGNYYYQNTRDDAHLAVPTGLEVIPNTRYIASVYVKAHVASSLVGLVVVEYTDDPGYWSNHIEPVTNRTSSNATGDWQRLSVPFTTLSNTKAVTLSLVTNGNVTSYWDGVQLERAGDGQTNPTDFPQDMNFNKSLENTAGWRTCIATSTDGVSFQKRGPVEIQGAVEGWQNWVRPGYVGDDSNYLNVFPYQGKWYAYAWVNGYRVDPSNPNVLDRGQDGVRRFGYEDRRIFFEGGGSARAALLVADSPLGPFQRIPRGGPLTHPTNEQQCQSGTQVNINQPWGCDYAAASGIPHQIGNNWVLFLSGMGGINASATYNGMYNGVCRGDGINSGLAISDNPLGPWTANNFSPLFPAGEVCQGNYALVPEGPIYFYDALSGNHVLFVNQLSDMSMTAFWTKDPLTNWSVANRKIILGNSTYPWYGEGVAKMPGSSAINLSTVVEENNKLFVYFGFREIHGHNGPSIGNYLFHDIGLLTMDLPLFPAIPTPTSTPIPPTATPIPPTSTPIPTFTPTPTPSFILEDLNHDNKVNISDYNILLQNFGSTTCNNIADIDSNCKVDIFDYNILVGNFGK